MTQSEQSNSSQLPVAIGLCPKSSHAVEFYFPLESAASVVRCPEPGCEHQLVVYVQRSNR